MWTTKLGAILSIAVLAAAGCTETSTNSGGTAGAGAAGGADGGDSPSSSPANSTSASSGVGGTGGGGCSIVLDDAALACKALALSQSGLSAPFDAGVIIEVHPDGLTIDAGADGQITLAWAGEDLTAFFTAGDAVTSIEDAYFAGIESDQVRVAVAYVQAPLFPYPPPAFSFAPSLGFALADECGWAECDPYLCFPSLPTKRMSLVVTGTSSSLTLLTGETGTINGVVVHHGGARVSPPQDNGSCFYDPLNTTSFTLLQFLP